MSPLLIVNGRPVAWVRRLILAVFLGTLWNFPAAGITVYVDPQITTASCTSYSPEARACGSGTAMAYRSLAGAMAVTAGTTVLIRGGAYPEQIAPQNSGGAGIPITFKNFPGETVKLSASPAISLASRNYIVIDGIQAEDTRWLEATNSHHNVLQNCVFKRTPATGTTGNVRFVQSHYNLILNNLIEDGNDNLLLIDANFNVVEGNTIIEGRHSVFGIRCGDRNVIRNNYFANTLQKIGEVYDCGADTSAVPNSFDSTKRNIIEGNTFANASSYYSTSGGNGIQYGGQQGIIRRNVFYFCNVGVGMQVYGDESLYNVDNSVYHNVFYANDGAGISTSGSTSGNVFKNNILLANQGLLPDCFAVSPGQLAFRSSLGASALFERNDLLFQTPGQPVVEEEFGNGMTVGQASARFPGMLIDTLEVDPQFVDAPNLNFNLRPGSPVIDAGTFLTRTTGAGSGTLLPVEDVNFFYDGFGVPGETGDLIQLAGQTQSARVIQIDYVNGSLSLDRSLNWTSGLGVALAFNGAAPDLGAIEAGAPLEDTSPPTVDITSPQSGAAVSGTLTVTASVVDDTGVAGVQFMLDGVSLGAEVTAPPWQRNWDTTATAPGTHSLTAVARDPAGNSAQSPVVTVTVSNTPGDTTPPVISKVLASPGTTSATITWTTNEPADSRVEYGTSTSYGSTASSSGMVSAHSVTLTGLRANALYYFRVLSKDAAGNQSAGSRQSFRTLRKNK